ncbi:MAG: SDR family NAD(P)-dependent oxidoreductase [Solirubrobacteraceae bacterium]
MGHHGRGARTSAGAAVVLADGNETALREITADLTTAGHQALGVACDVSDARQVVAMVERAVGECGRLDMAFNNAGMKTEEEVVEANISRIRKQVPALPTAPAIGRVLHTLDSAHAQSGRAVGIPVHP